MYSGSCLANALYGIPNSTMIDIMCMFTAGTSLYSSYEYFTAARLMLATREQVLATREQEKEKKEQVKK